MNSLGLELYVSGFMTEGHREPDELTTDLGRVVNFIGMDSGGMKPQVWIYPIHDGKGGVGSTNAQPLVESIAFNMSSGKIPGGLFISDSWADHNHVFWVIASCREFCHRRLGSWLNENVGAVLDDFRGDLGRNRAGYLLPDRVRHLMVAEKTGGGIVIAEPGHARGN